ncbi:MAG: hypothetical protein ACKV2T_38870 [Kofleriaceae bacterium]
MRAFALVVLAACGGSQVANVPPPSADQARAPTQAAVAERSAPVFRDLCDLEAS